MTTSLLLRAAVPAKTGLSAESAGMLLGLTGVAIFSLTLPFTRMAVSAFDPAFVAFGRAVVAAGRGCASKDIKPSQTSRKTIQYSAPSLGAAPSQDVQ